MRVKKASEPEKDNRSRLERWLGLEQGAKYHIGRRKKVYPALVDGRKVYMPRLEDATEDDKRRGWFIKEPGKKLANGEEGHELYTSESLDVVSDDPDTGDDDNNKAEEAKPKYDPETGRMLFPIEDTDGNIIHVPRESEATEQEKEDQLFRPDDAVDSLLTEEEIQQAKEEAERQAEDQADDGDSPDDPDTEENEDDGSSDDTETDDDDEEDTGEGSEASEPEKDNRSRLERWLGLEQGAKYHIGRRKKVYPALVDGRKVYMPRLEDATEDDKRRGWFIKEPGKKLANGEEGHELYTSESLDVVSDDPDTGDDDNNNKAEEAKPKYDPETGRMLFPIEDTDGNIIHVPRESEATEQEKQDQLFRPDDAVDSLLTEEEIQQAKEEAEKQASDQADGEEANPPVPRYTPIEDGKPTYNEETGRTLYASKDENDNILFLPVQSEATADEVDQGRFLPDESVKKDPVSSPRKPDSGDERREARAERAARLSR